MLDNEVQRGLAARPPRLSLAYAMGHFDSLFSLTTEPMCVLSLTGEVRRSNRAFEDLLAAATPESLQSCVDEQGARAVAQALAALDAATPSARAETFVPAVHRWYDWHLTRVDDATVIAAGRDITSMRETTTALAEKSAFLHSIIEAQPECVKIVSRSGELLDMNRAGLRMVGAEKRDDAIGLSVFDLVAPEDRERFVEFHDRVCEGTGGKLDFDIISLDGTRRSMHTIAVPFPNAPGGELVHLAITRDVTERLLLERQLYEARRMEAIGQLAGGIAHDFNNLLTAIISPADLALCEVEPGTQVARDLKQIKQTAERAARITQRLLSFAKQEVAQPVPMSVGDLVLGAHDMLQRMMGTSYELQLDVDRELPAVFADHGQLEQVLLNLVVNARDALAGSGTVGITLEEELVSPERGVALGCEAGTYVALRVTDDGPGVSDSIQDKIFEPFFTTKAPGAGTGLGLPTCVQILAGIGGAMDFTTEAGTGSCFTALLPLATEPVATPAAAPSSRAAQGERILVVDDEELVRKSVARILQAAGYVVVHVASGADALAAIGREGDFDLVLSDITMPRMSGLELAAEIRRRRPELEILFMTGYHEMAASGAQDRAFDACDVLQKPFAKVELLAAVARAITRRANVP